MIRTRSIHKKVLVCIAIILLSYASAGKTEAFTEKQIGSVLQLLASFQVSQSTIDAVKVALRAGPLRVSLSPTPPMGRIQLTAQPVVFANYILDTAGAAEDLSISAFTASFETNGNPDNLTNCQLLKSGTALTTRENSNSSSVSGNIFFALDDAIVLRQQSVTILSLVCSLSPFIKSGTYFAWGYDSSSPPAARGIISGKNILAQGSKTVGSRITIDMPEVSTAQNAPRRESSFANVWEAFVGLFR